MAAVLATLGRNGAAADAGRTVVTDGGFGVTASESVVVKLRQGRPAPARVRVDMIPSLETEEGVIGEALAGTILDGLPGVEGGGRYDGRRYHPMQRRARGARIRASEQHPMRAAGELTLTPGRSSSQPSPRSRSRRSDDCLRRGVTSAWRRVSWPR